MENYINIAKLSYTINSVNKSVQSNPCVISYSKPIDIVSGEITCGLSRKKWKLYLIEEDTNWIYQSLSGSTSEKFSFDIEPLKQYKLKFVCQKGCCLYIDTYCQNRISQISFKQI